MANNSWARAYSLGEQIIGKPTGKTVRPFPGGQKVGFPTVQNSPFSGQANSKVIEIARYDSANEASPLSGSINVDISTPSNRLRCGVSVYFEFQSELVTTTPIAGATPLAVSLIAIAVNPQNGQSSPMQVIGSANGPNSFAIDPIYRDVRLVAQVNTLNLDYTSMNITLARLMVIANWEPNVELAADELNRLYGMCSISTPRAVSV